VLGVEPPTGAAGVFFVEDAEPAADEEAGVAEAGTRRLLL
jgi:hypothetical protein